MLKELSDLFIEMSICGALWFEDNESLNKRAEQFRLEAVQLAELAQSNYPWMHSLTESIGSWQRHYACISAPFDDPVKRNAWIAMKTRNAIHDSIQRDLEDRQTTIQDEAEDAVQLFAHLGLSAIKKYLNEVENGIEPSNGANLYSRYGIKAEDIMPHVEQLYIETQCSSDRHGTLDAA